MRTTLIALATLCAAWLSGPPALQAQDGVALRAAHNGSFLPEGTRIVVLARQAQAERYGRRQPEFIGLEAYPTQPQLVFRRDVLSDDGFSGSRYRPTSESGLLYYLYAVTPDSSLYWSYSAQRDSLKFDVVSTGVMSVAPVLETDVRDDVLRRFFRQRVVVHMPGDSTEDDAADSAAAVATADTSRNLPEAAASAPGSSLIEDGAPVSVPPVAAARPPSGARSSTPIRLPGALPALIVLCVGGLAAVVYSRRQRRKTRRLRLEIIGLREQAREADAATTLRGELDDLRAQNRALSRELDEIRAQRRDLLCERAALQRRCAALEGEVED